MSTNSTAASLPAPTLGSVDWIRDVVGRDGLLGLEWQRSHLTDPFHSLVLDQLLDGFGAAEMRDWGHTQTTEAAHLTFLEFMVDLVCPPEDWDAPTW